MAPRQEADSDFDEAERARLSLKLDGYEAMGLDVDELRVLLDEDPERFKTTYLGVIRAQLEGGKEGEVEEAKGEAPEEIEVERPPEGTDDDEGTDREDMVDEEDHVTEEVPSEDEEPSEEVLEEEVDEEMELQLEGAGPEEALAGAAIPEEEEDLTEEAAEEEEIPLEDGTTEEEVVEEEVTEEEVPEEEVPEEEAPEEEVPEEEVPQEDRVEISIEEDHVPEEPTEEVPEEGEVAPEEMEEAEIQVGEAPEEEPVEEAPEEGPEEDEALIVVAEVIEEATPPEEETEVRLAGLTPEERADEVAPEDDEELEDAEEPEPPRPRPVKKVVAKKPVDKPSKPKEEPVKKAPPKKAPTKKAPPKKAAAKPAKKKAPPKKARRRAIPMSVIAILVAVMLVVSATGLYFTVLKNEEPIALFTFDPSSPQMGEIVSFDARNSHDPDEGTIEKYVWDFGDGTSAKGRVVTHSFIEARDFPVRLTIEDDGGARDTTTRTVTVEALEISMERPNLSDFFKYDVDGNVSLNNGEGLFTFEGPTGGDEFIYEIEAIVEGDKTFDIITLRNAKDGFMKDHDDARMERTNYVLPDIKGTIVTSLAVNPSFTGKMDAIVEEDICQHWERGIRSSVTMNADFSAMLAGQAWADLSTFDEGTFYSQLTGISDTFSLNEFLRENTFSSEDVETHPLPIGGNIYMWKVVGMERVSGRPVPSLHINVTMDRTSLNANNLDLFFIDVWLEPGLSQPAKYHVYVSGQDEGNRYKVDMTEVLTDHNKGNDEAWGQPCRADHSFTMKTEYPDDFHQLDHVPVQGGTAGGFQFNPEDAYQDALGIPEFATYMTDHPEAFFHVGSYSAKGPGSIQTDSDDRDKTDDTLPLASPTTIGEVVTLSRGVRLLRGEPDIEGRCFDGNEVDWSSYTFNITESVSTISLDPTTVLVGSQETGYVYLLVSRGGPLEHKAALDATNGQVLFTWVHSQNWETFEAFV
jgi:PKD repeat protein